MRPWTAVVPIDRIVTAPPRPRVVASAVIVERASIATLSPLRARTARIESSRVKEIKRSRMNGAESREACAPFTLGAAIGFERQWRQRMAGPPDRDGPGHRDL